MIRDVMLKYRSDLTDVQLDRFETYYKMLIDWNSRMNLTAITEEDDVAKKHFIDSLAADALIPQNAECIDVGTGAGFPGIPLMILREDIRVTLLDSLNKRLLFLDELTKRLGLTNRVQIVHARAEDGGREKQLREKFDVALSRAVASLPVLLELTIPFLKKGGISICYKGNIEEELALSKTASGLLKCILDTKRIESDYGERTLVIAKKTGSTPAVYPRKAGTPAKKPL